MSRALLLSTLTAIAFVLASTPAHAGWYDVKACMTSGSPSGNASWTSEVPGPYATAYTNCPGEGIVARMSGGAGTAPYGAGARNVFSAPPGTRIVRFRSSLKIKEARGWRAGLVDATPRWVWCGTGGCDSSNQYGPLDWGISSPQLFAQVTCGNPNGCPRSALDGLITIRDVIVTVED